MKSAYTKVLIFVAVVCASAVGGIYIGLLTENRAQNENIPEKSAREVFAWGVNTSPYQIDGYYPKTALRQIDLMKKLGVNTVRMMLERDVQLDPFKITYHEKYNDDFINKLNEANLDVALVLDGDIIGTAKPGFDQEAEGYKLGSYAASRYQGKVKYYQISNEITGTVVKPSDPEFKGELMEGKYGLQYSADRYRSALGWLSGMSKGIRECDPEAKIIVSGHWILYDIVERMIKEGLDFDILGWAWYSTDGLDITSKEIEGQNVNLFRILNGLGKSVWIIESNYDHGSYNESDPNQGEIDQAQFFQEFLDRNLKLGLFKGYFVYSMFDDPSFASKAPERDGHWGLVSVTKGSGGHPDFTPKKAYSTYQHIIKENPANSLF